MTQEDKELLLKDLCGRLPYDVQAEGLYEEYDDNDKIIQIKTCGFITCITRSIVTIGINDDCKLGTVKPYLRPMSSMTEEEMEELRDKNIFIAISTSGTVETTIDGFDWLNKNMFDYRGLIEKGLALEAPEGMYKEK